jgi:hypothetical protein
MRKKKISQLRNALRTDKDSATKVLDTFEKNNSNLRRIIFFFIILLLGTGSIFILEIFYPKLEHKETLRDMALAITAVGLVEFLNLLLRSGEIEEAFDRSIHKNLPESIQRVRDSGLLDYHENLTIEELGKKISNSYNTDIKILRIRFFEFALLKSEIRKSILDNECTVEIILLTPFSTAMIEKRIKQVQEGVASTEDIIIFQNQILSIIKEIDSFRGSLEENYKTKLMLKVHNSFTSVSLTGFNHEWILGIFLLGQDVINGSHLTIKGSDKPFQIAADKHYKIQNKLSWPFPFNENWETKKQFLESIASK